MGRPRDPARLEARKAGARHYQGRPCAHGHTLRHTVSGACVVCQAEAQRQRRKASTRCAPEVPELAEMLG